MQPEPSPRQTNTFQRTFTMRSTMTKAREDGDSRGSEMVARQTDAGFFGYFMTTKKETAAAAPVWTVDSFLDLTVHHVPGDVQLLNQGNIGKRMLSFQESEILLDDLCKLFFECLAARLDDGSGGGGAVMNVLRESTASNTAAPRTRRELDQYYQAKALSVRLASVDLPLYFQLDENSFFIKLSNVLCIHASIELDLEMREVAAQHADRIAYNVGQRLMTAAQLQGMI